MHLPRNDLRSLPVSFFSSAWAEQAMPSGVDAFFGTPLVTGALAVAAGGAFGAAAGGAVAGAVCAMASVAVIISAANPTVSLESDFVMELCPSLFEIRKPDPTRRYYSKTLFCGKTAEGSFTQDFAFEIGIAQFGLYQIADTDEARQPVAVDHDDMTNPLDGHGL